MRTEKRELDVWTEKKKKRKEGGKRESEERGKDRKLQTTMKGARPSEIQ